jgi:hypothetical protein
MELDAAAQRHQGEAEADHDRTDDGDGCGDRDGCEKEQQRDQEAEEQWDVETWIPVQLAASSIRGHLHKGP